MSSPSRRRTDLRPAHALFGPTPGALSPVDRAAFLRSLELALESARRERRSLTLVVVDLGPNAGDAVLARSARLVRNTIRESDGVWRTGARSLAVLLQDADGPTAEPAVARLRLRLKADGAAAGRVGRATAAPGIAPEELMGLAEADCRPLVPQAASGSS